MSFAASRARMVDALFVHLGEDAAWEGLPGMVRVITRDEDQTVEGPGDMQLLAQTLIFRVRRSEVAEPEVGKLVTLDADGTQYRVSADASCDRKGVWRVPVEPA